MHPIVIIGTGLAGYTLAREFRKLDQTTALTLVTGDDGVFYSKPMLSNAFAQGKDASALAGNSAAAMAEQLNATIMTQCTVQSIDPLNQTIETSQGPVNYSRLVLAWGADPIRIPLEGNGAGDVLSVNDLGDYARFRQRLGDARRVAILGGGLIGCEFANDLVGAGYTVRVIDLAPLPLGRLVPEACGVAIRDALGDQGIDWHLGTSISHVTRAAGGLAVELADGTRFETDVLLSAVGLRPRTALAAQAGLTVGRGIQVNRLLQTSDPSIFALGDCAEVAGLVLPYVMPIMHAARALAKTLAGTPTDVAYPAMPVVVKTPALPVVVAPPAADKTGAWEITQDGRDIEARFIGGDGTLQGFALTGARTASKQQLTRELPAILA